MVLIVVGHIIRIAEKIGEADARIKSPVAAAVAEDALQIRLDAAEPCAGYLPIIANFATGKAA